MIRKPRYKKKRLTPIDVPPALGALKEVIEPTKPRAEGDYWLSTADVLCSEWAILYPNTSPHSFCLSKGYDASDIAKLSATIPFESWPDRRDAIQNKLTETLAKRHIDKLAEANEQHMNASKLGLAQAVKMLAEGKTEFLRDKEGKIVTDAKGNPRYKQFRSVDLLNCMSAIEKAQIIYRRAFGLPNDEGGLAQILKHLEKLNEVKMHTTVNFTQNVQNNNTEVKVEGPQELSADDIMMLIEATRTAKAKAALQEDARLKIEHKEGVPTGDYTAQKRTGGI